MLILLATLDSAIKDMRNVVTRDRVLHLLKKYPKLVSFFDQGVIERVYYDHLGRVPETDLNKAHLQALILTVHTIMEELEFSEDTTGRLTAVGTYYVSAHQQDLTIHVGLGQDPDPFNSITSHTAFIFLHYLAIFHGFLTREDYADVKEHGLPASLTLTLPGAHHQKVHTLTLYLDALRAGKDLVPLLRFIDVENTYDILGYLVEELETRKDIKLYKGFLKSPNFWSWFFKNHPREVKSVYMLCVVLYDITTNPDLPEWFRFNEGRDLEERFIKVVRALVSRWPTAKVSIELVRMLMPFSKYTYNRKANVMITLAVLPKLLTGWSDVSGNIVSIINSVCHSTDHLHFDLIYEVLMNFVKQTPKDVLTSWFQLPNSKHFFMESGPTGQLVVVDIWKPVVAAIKDKIQ